MTADDHNQTGADGEGPDAAPTATFPPIPDIRHITPAPEDFEHPPGFANYLWPLLWCGLIGVLIGVLLCGGWPPAHPH